MRSLIAAAILAIVLAGTAEAKKKAPTVTVGSNFYAAQFKTVKSGSKVKFKWEAGGGFEVHDVNVEKGPTKFRSPLQAGGSFTTKKLKAGTYVLFCSQHPEEMRLSFKVKK